MAKKKYTNNQEEYRKQIKRLNRIINDNFKKGIVYPNSLPTELPPRVTKKEIELLKAIKPKHILQMSNYVTPEGTVISYKEYEAIKQNINKAVYDMYAVIKDRVLRLPDVRYASGKWMEIEPHKQVLLDALDDGYAMFENYDEYLHENQDILFTNLDVVAMDSAQERIMASINIVLDILKNGSPLTHEEASAISDFSDALDSYDNED